MATKTKKRRGGPKRLSKDDLPSPEAKPPEQIAAEIAADNARFRSRARDLAEIARAAGKEEDDYREKALEAKHRKDGALADLEKLALAEEEETPLFDQKPSANGHPASDDAWRSVPLTEALAGVSPNLLDKMRTAELETMGQYSNFCNAARPEFGKHPLTTIKGIGQAKAELIEQAAQDFWARQATEKPEAKEAPGELVDGGEDDEGVE